MSVLKATTVGNSVGVILPKEILERVRVGERETAFTLSKRRTRSNSRRTILRFPKTWRLPRM